MFSDKKCFISYIKEEIKITRCRNVQKLSSISVEVTPDPVHLNSVTYRHKDSSSVVLCTGLDSFI